MLQLYKNIKSRREELKMSQEKLAKKAGYSSRTKYVFFCVIMTVLGI